MNASSGSGECARRSSMGFTGNPLRRSRRSRGRIIGTDRAGESCFKGIEASVSPASDPLLRRTGRGRAGELHFHCADRTNRCFMDGSIRQFATQVIETEAAAVRAVAGAIGDGFERAVRLILDCPASVLTCGIGKAGHVARKLSATLASTGTPSHFLSPTDAVHGDLGSIRRGDVVLILSASGESDEILRLLSIVKKLDHPVIAITGSKANSLGRFADVVLPMGK